MRKDLKAPDNYVKKHQIVHIKETSETHELHTKAFVADFDVEKTEKYIVSAGQTNKQVNLYDRSKNIVSNQISIDFNPKIVKFIPNSNFSAMIAEPESGIVQSWDMLKRKKNLDIVI